MSKLRNSTKVRRRSHCDVILSQTVEHGMPPAHEGREQPGEGVLPPRAAALSRRGKMYYLPPRHPHECPQLEQCVAGVCEAALRPPGTRFAPSLAGRMFKHR